MDRHAYVLGEKVDILKLPKELAISIVGQNVYDLILKRINDLNKYPAKIKTEKLEKITDEDKKRLGKLLTFVNNEKK